MTFAHILQIELLKRACTLDKSTIQLQRFKGMLHRKRRCRLSQQKHVDASAIEKVQQLSLVFQPIVSVKQEGTLIKGYETLLRHGDGVFFPFEVFHELTSSEASCDALNAWYEKTFEYYLTKYPEALFNLNIDMKQMKYASTWRMLKHISRYKGRICIELTEFYQVTTEENRRLFYESMNYFRSLGLAISFDDVGNGQHSLSFVTKNIHLVDTVKLSLLHFQHLDSDIMSSVLKIWVKISKTYHVNLVVEGIETMELANFLKERGICCQQGFIWGAPSPNLGH